MNTELTSRQIFDTLDAYRQWFLRCWPIHTGFKDGVRMVGDFCVVTLHREDDLQTQLVCCKPGSAIPEHAHPGVDSLLMQFSGNIELTVGEGGIHTAGADYRTLAFVPSGVKHSGKINEEGCTFLNFQRWHNGQPTSAELDWDGPLLGENHAPNIAGI